MRAMCANFVHQLRHLLHHGAEHYKYLVDGDLVQITAVAEQAE